MIARIAPSIARVRGPALGALIALGGCARDPGPVGATDGSGETFPYEVIFEGDAPADLVGYLEEVSNAARDADEPPSSLTLVHRRGRADVDILTKAMASRGYYSGSVSSVTRRIPEDERSVERPGFEPPVARIVFDVEAGPLYRLRQLETRVVDPENGYAPPPPRALGLEQGAAGEARAVIDALEALTTDARERGYPFARTLQPLVIVDHPANAMDVRLETRSGPIARLAPPTFSGGGEDVHSGAKRKRAPWEPGDVYAPALIEEGRSRLVQTGLFSRVRSVLGQEPNEEDLLPVEFEVTDRPRRTIGGGAGFRTDEGPRVSVFWEHRNILGGGERLRIDGAASLDDYSLGATFRRLDVLRRDQNLIGDAEFAHEETDVFVSDSLSVGAALERQLAEGLVGALGARFRAVEIEEGGDTEAFALISIPGSLSWDTSDDLLDPSEGGRLRLQAAPFFDALGSGSNFVKGRASYAHYFRLIEEPRLVFAARGAFGAIVGAATDDVPADERFYAGGGGSLRGYAFQAASPRDAGGDVVGGRSVIELAAETRLDVTENVGVVVFLDAGSAFDPEYPDFDRPLLFGAGGGLRYATPIGPLRFDLGVPLDRRSFDDSFQIYVSIGQAF